jgi:hypothetical protein
MLRESRREGDRMKRRISVCFAAACAAACTPTPQTAPSDNRVLLPRAGGRVGGETVYGAVLGPFASLNDDCSVKSFARVRILQQPANGSAVVAVRRGTASFEANNLFARCNGAPVSAPFVVYTPRDGFVGRERFRFEVVFSDGERRILAPELSIGPRP